MKYYRVYYNKCRLRELLRLTRPHYVSALLIWAARKVGITCLQSQIVPRPDSLAEVLVEETTLPELFRHALLDSVSQAGSLGFEDPIYEYTESDGIPTAGGCARCYHRSGQYIFLSAIGSNKSGQRSEQAIISFFEDGVILSTANGYPKFDLHHKNNVRYYPQGPIYELLAKHQDSLLQFPNSPIRVNSRSLLIREVDAMTDRFFDYMVERGIFEEIPGYERATGNHG